MSKIIDIYPHLGQEFVYSFDKRVKNYNFLNSKYRIKNLWKCKNKHLILKTTSAFVKSGCSQCANIELLKTKSLEAVSPILASEWDEDKNKCKASEIFSGAGGVFWWKCKKCHHSFQNTLNNRKNSGVGCPRCSGYILIEGINDIATIYPQVKSNWGTKNDYLPHEILSQNSKSKEFWWRCKNGNHEYYLSLGKFIDENRGCPYCSGHRFETGINDFLSLNPIESKKWDFEKNKIDPSQVYFRSKKSFWFKCDFNEDHRYKLTLLEINKKNTLNCYYCDNSKLLKGFNDLLTISPELKKFWSDSNDLDIEDVKYNDCNIFKWRSCPYNHIFKRNIYNMKNNQECPYCSNNIVLVGFNDLFTVASSNKNYSSLLGEWDYAKNNITPNEILFRSNKKIYWKCINGHEFTMRLSSRVSRGSSCITCNYSLGYSKNELNFCSSIVKEVNLSFEQNNRNVLSGLEIDLFFPNEKIAIEYNGDYWHNPSFFPNCIDRHHRKMLKCNELGILLIVVWESQWMKNPDQVIKHIKHMIRKRKVVYGYDYSYLEKEYED